jgi:tRNA pseudouridine38-40 synthase
MEKRNILLTITYDGTNYNGWQIQPDAPTIQGQIQTALSKILSDDIKVTGAGRTDAKAHAIRYNANFLTANLKIPVKSFSPALNAVLPDDIRILQAEEVFTDFNARFSAKAREYIYILENHHSVLPMFRNYVYAFPFEINPALLKQATSLFQGTYDFTNFCYGYGDDEKNFVRKVYYFRFAKRDKTFIFFIKGEGFLQGMIRTLVSVCINCASSENNPKFKSAVSLERLKSALERKIELESKYRVAVPANGLYFKRAYY